MGEQTRWSGYFLLAALCALAPWSAARAWEHFPMPVEPGLAGIVVGDFDGDGRTEVLIGGTLPSQWGQGNGAAMLVLLGGEGSHLRVRDALGLEMMVAQDGLVLAKGLDGRDRAVAAVSLPDGTSRIATFGGVPLRLEHLLPAPLGYRVKKVFAVADIDVDGEPEIIAALAAEPGYWSSPAILDGATGAVRWLGETIESTVTVAQLDADAALELIVSGTPGLVIDGATTHAVEWSWAGGFGGLLLGGRFGASAAEEFVTVPTDFSSYLQVFRGSPYAPALEIQNAERINYIVAAPRPDGTGDEVAVQSDYSLRFFDPLTGLTTREFASGGPGPFAVADILAEGRTQVIRRTVPDPTCLLADAAVELGDDDEARYRYGFSVADLDGNSCHHWVEKMGPHAAVLRGRLGGAGSDQIASFSRNNVLTLFDAASGTPLRFRTSVLTLNSPPAIQHASMILTARADAAASIVVASDSSSPVALDPLTLEPRWSAFAAPMRVSAMSGIDVNGDGSDEIVLVAADGQLVVLDGGSGAVLGQSAAGASWFWPGLVTFQDDQGRPRAMVPSEDGMHLDLFDLVTVTRIAQVEVGTRPVIALWSWGEGAGCRVAVLDDAARIGVRDCNSLGELDHRQAPPGTIFVREADASGSTFIVAAGEHLYHLDADGVATQVSPALGRGLGAQNAGDVRMLPGGDRWDATMGSDTLVTRRMLAPDPLFTNGFD